MDATVPAMSPRFIPEACLQVNRIPIASRLRKTSLMAGQNRRLGLVRARSQFLIVATLVPSWAAKVFWVRRDRKRYSFRDLESKGPFLARGCESPLTALITRWQKGCKKDPFRQIWGVDFQRPTLNVQRSTICPCALDTFELQNSRFADNKPPRDLADEKRYSSTRSGYWSVRTRLEYDLGGSSRWLVHKHPDDQRSIASHGNVAAEWEGSGRWRTHE